MDNKLLNKTITISSEETKRTQYGMVKKIKDENNLTYSVFQTKQDGSESAAWVQYKNLNIGDTVQISYVEEPKEFEGKGYMARTIRNFNSDIGNGVKQYQNSQPAKSLRYEASGASGANQRGTTREKPMRSVALSGLLQYCKGRKVLIQLFQLTAVHSGIYFKLSK